MKIGVMNVPAVPGLPGDMYRFHSTAAGEMPLAAASRDKKGFVIEPSGRPFLPWGLNYGHDEQGRLMEDYWRNRQ